jgi:pimeloyl-ACP methyl ester carboxylesterase
VSHVPTFSQQRDVLIYQPYGLGELEAGDHALASYSGGKPFSNVSLPAQAERLIQTIDYAFPDAESVDVAGFSLGGRIALCAAALHPDRISHLHLTGVSLKPSTFATVSYQAWKHMLRRSNLQGVAWSSLLASYHPTYLATQKSRLSSWVEHVCRHHTCQGLLALLEQTHTDEWSVENMVRRISDSEYGVKATKIRLCVGRDDRIAPLNSVLSLAKTFGMAPDDPISSVSVLDNCGHAVPIEASRVWRQNILQFIDDRK